MTEPNRSTTGRGFTVYDEFTDTYGSTVIVQESSSAEGARIWIFCRHGGFPQKANEPHLDVEQARRVRDALDTFIGEHGTGRETKEGDDG